jgi:lysozyme
VNIDVAGEHLIAQYEGFSPIWYPDSGGVETIGFGHTGPLLAGFRAPLSIEEAYALLRLDAETAVGAVNAAVRVSLGTIFRHAQARANALYSLAFNIGGPAFQGSTLLRRINEQGAPRDWHQVAPYWLEWDHDNGLIIPGLLARRRSEIAIFVPGVMPLTLEEGT